MPEEQDPPEETSDEFQFKDIARLPNRDIQVILREISGKDIALAIKGADEDLRKRVFDNVSKRVATMIRDEMKLQAAAKIHDVLEMRSVITTVARGLISSGVITWPPSAQPARSVEPARQARPHPPPVARPARKRSTRRIVIQVVGGLGSAAILVIAAVLLGRLSRAPAPPEHRAEERGRVSGTADQATGTSDRAGGDVTSGAPQQADASTGGDAAQSAPGAGGSGDQGVPPVDAPPHDSGAEGDSAAGTVLTPGARLDTEGKSASVYRLPDDAGKLEVAPNSSLSIAPEPQAADPEKDQEPEKEPPRMDLRLGNVVVDVTDSALEVTSPVARVTATEGSRYRIRVVLDATTTVRVLSGIVWLRPTAHGESGLVILQPGDEARVSPTGRVSVDRRK